MEERDAWEFKAGQPGRPSERKTCKLRANSEEWPRKKTPWAPGFGQREAVALLGKDDIYVKGG